MLHSRMALHKIGRMSHRVSTSSARLRAGLRVFSRPFAAPVRLIRCAGSARTRGDRVALFVLALFVLALQSEMQRHVLSHALESVPAVVAVAQDAAVDPDGDRLLEDVCLECLALAALDLPGVAPFHIPFAAIGELSLPATAARAACFGGVWWPHCRAPPSSFVPNLFS